MPDNSQHDLTTKFRAFATKGLHFVFDEIGDAWVQVRSKVRDDHEAIQEIAELLASPPAKDPLALIRDIEDRLGVDHYDWPKHGRWIGDSVDIA